MLAIAPFWNLAIATPLISTGRAAVVVETADLHDRIVQEPHDRVEQMRPAVVHLPAAGHCRILPPFAAGGVEPALRDPAGHELDFTQSSRIALVRRDTETHRCMATET